MMHLCITQKINARTGRPCCIAYVNPQASQN